MIDSLFSDPFKCFGSEGGLAALVGRYASLCVLEGASVAGPSVLAITPGWVPASSPKRASTIDDLRPGRFSQSHRPKGVAVIAMVAAAR